MVGPGSYFGKQASPSPQLKDKREHLWGTERKFKSIESIQEKAAAVPGPGSYQDQNKWQKRTYNLKFLNVGGASPDFTG
jgi:hypothetical protein